MKPEAGNLTAGLWHYFNWVCLADGEDGKQPPFLARTDKLVFSLTDTYVSEEKNICCFFALFMV